MKLGIDRLLKGSEPPSAYGSDSDLRQMAIDDMADALGLKPEAASKLASAICRLIRLEDKEEPPKVEISVGG